MNGPVSSLSSLVQLLKVAREKMNDFPDDAPVICRRLRGKITGGFPIADCPNTLSIEDVGLFRFREIVTSNTGIQEIL